MDATPEVQTYVVVSFVIFLAFVMALTYLLVSLLAHQALLKKARAELQDYAQNLEKKVELRTAELKASEEEYRNLFESSRESILVVQGSSGEILKANNEAEALFGYPRAELFGTQFSNLMADFSFSGDDWQERVIKRRDGSSRQVDCLTSPIFYDGINCWQILCRDVTERRELELQLIQSQKMSALGQLAAGVAHELNTPLGTIYNSSYFIKEEIGEGFVKVKKHFHLIESQVERCRKIIKDLLNFSRAPNLEIELKKTDLNALLDGCLNIMAKEIQSSGINIYKDLQELPFVMVDPQRISQVFFNLILNAVQAMPMGGSLTIRSWNNATQASPDKEGNHNLVKFGFEDTGVGIPAEALNKIFTPFYTTRKEIGGIGLGLSVSYRIIQQFGGEIKAESEPSKGSHFTISLPVLR
ncbi:MAG: ATP-binding protein [bacterium]|nr:ATP-binding protein [bacterium]